MKASELLEKSDQELKQELIKLRKEQFDDRINQAIGQFGQPHLFKEKRRDIARIKTEINARSQAASSKKASGQSES